MIVVRNILHFIVLLLLQILLFNHLDLWGLCHPYIYIIGLICMPLLPRWVDMLIGFCVGLLMDMFCSSLGIHVAACVLLCYIRPMVVDKIVQDSDRVLADVSADTIGWNQFMRLSLLLCLLHHGIVFMMDACTLSNLWITLLRWFISSGMTMLVIIGYCVFRKSS